MKNIVHTLMQVCLFGMMTLGVFAQTTTIRPNVVSNPQLSYDAIVALPSPQRGDTVYDLTFNCLRVYNGTKWVCTFQSPTDPTPNMAAIAKAGGTSDDGGKSVVVDGNGNVYVTGSFGDIASFGGNSLTSMGNVYLTGEFSGTASFDGTSLFSAGYADMFLLRIQQ